MAWCHQCGRQLEDDERRARAGRPRARQRGAAPTQAEVGEATAQDRCPACGMALEVEDGTDGDQAAVKAPWHFKVLVVGTVVYLGYRLYQGIGWLIHHA